VRHAFSLFNTAVSAFNGQASAFNLSNLRRIDINVSIATFDAQIAGHNATAAVLNQDGGNFPVFAPYALLAAYNHVEAAPFWWRVARADQRAPIGFHVPGRPIVLPELSRPCRARALS
jgi:hypothetical protein